MIIRQGWNDDRRVGGVEDAIAAPTSQAMHTTDDTIWIIRELTTVEQK